jgi:signal transduction histidine kinase
MHLPIKMGVMKPRLLILLLIIGGLAAITAWAEYTSWKEAAGLEQQLKSSELHRVLALSDNWTAADREALRDVIADAQISLVNLRAWLIASSAGVLVLAMLLGRTVHQEMIAPLKRRLVESHAVITRQEKLASLGVLAAGVAHEIRNPLVAIKARLFSQMKKLSIATTEYADAEFIDEEVDRLEKIVKDVLRFAQPAEPSLECVSAAQFLRVVRELMTPETENRDIDLRLEVPANLYVNIDLAQMKQVMINLVGNSAESIGRGGTITLRARSTFMPLPAQRMPAVALEVEDSGPGIPPEVQQRLFDPFFTTKEAGTGLGLPIAARITEKHGGFLQYRTQSPGGTTFSVILPATDDENCR